jgi:hypothetical protein
VAVHLKLVYERATLDAEDVAITTHDFEGDDWNQAAVDAVAVRLTTWWNAISEHFIATTRLREMRVYNGYNGDGSPGEVDFVKTINLPGTGAGTMLPPQCACTISETFDEAHLRRHWGRFYLPINAVNSLGASGRWSAATITDLIEATQAWYNGMVTDGRPPIVWVSAAGGGAALVDELRIDDIVDIQRRRRWDKWTQRTTRNVLP